MGLSNWLHVRIMWEPQNHQIRATPQTNCIRPLGWGGVGWEQVSFLLYYSIIYTINVTLLIFFKHNVL